jgi:hypothetical protein
MDELSHANWFTSLDLCAGFHQIPMDLANCFKIAFQTHVGHYEFRVMSFGLTGAPHTFQKAMNSSLAPLLRKCVMSSLMTYWFTMQPLRITWYIWIKCFSCCNNINGK